MTINPIIPIWLMIIICIVMLVFKRKGVFPYIRQIVAAILLFMINLRIMVPDGSVTYKQQELNTKVIFVVDSTISMLAQDYNGSEERLTGVKEDCKDIIDKLEGAKFEFISFDNEVYVLSPFSNDAQFAKNAVDSIYPIDQLYARGSSLNIWHDITLEKLKQARESDDGQVVLFFISDGENNAGDKLASFKDLSKYIDNGAVLGYGTKEGGIMQMTRWDEVETIEDPEEWDKPGISKIDENNLKKFASDLGVNYINMNSKKGIDSCINEILKNASTKDTDKKEIGYKDIYFVFLIPFLMLVIFEYIEIKRRK